MTRTCPALTPNSPFKKNYFTKLSSSQQFLSALVGVLWFEAARGCRPNVMLFARTKQEKDDFIFFPPGSSLAGSLYSKLSQTSPS